MAYRRVGATIDCLRLEARGEGRRRDIGDMARLTDCHGSEGAKSLQSDSLSRQRRSALTDCRKSPFDIVATAANTEVIVWFVGCNRTGVRNSGGQKERNQMKPTNHFDECECSRCRPHDDCCDCLLCEAIEFLAAEGMSEQEAIEHINNAAKD